MSAKGVFIRVELPPGWVVSQKSFLDPKSSFELTLCSSYSQTKPVLLWNIILGVCSSRNKNFVKRISPANRTNPAHVKLPGGTRLPAVQMAFFFSSSPTRRKKITCANPSDLLSSNMAAQLFPCPIRIYCTNPGNWRHGRLSSNSKFKMEFEPFRRTSSWI